MLLVLPGFGSALIIQLVIFSLVYLAVRFVSGRLFDKNKALNIRVFTATLLFALLILEITLRCIGSYNTYLEEKLGKYVSLRDIMLPEDIIRRKPLDTITLSSKGEFHYLFTTNKYHYTDIAWPDSIADTSLRVLVLGDSFTEGFGAPQDSSWVAMIRQMDFGQPVSWFNAAISGSDPFFGYYSLVHHLSWLKPDIVLQMVSSQDFRDDIPIRGGMERFRPNGSIRYSPGKYPENIYKYSHISRFWFRSILGLNQFLVDEQKSAGVNEKSLMLVASLDSAYHHFASDNNARAYFIFFPCFWGEVVRENYSADIMNHMTRNTGYSGNIKVIDLLPCYREYYLRENEAFHDRWWPIDGHHNVAGYQMMAECIAGAVKDILTPIPNRTP